jgi:DNA-binding CsgD family transcriptional regulator
MSCRYTTKKELSPRQAEVVALIAEGRTNAAIAVRLSISENTVKQHVGDLVERLGASNRAHAALLAYESGALPVAASA